MMLDRYTLKSIISLFLSTVATIISLLLMVELFINISTYTSDGMTFFKTMYLIALKIPNAFNMVVGPCMLFAITYTISNMYANNEIICLLSSGVSYYRLVFPIVLFSFFMTAFCFFFNELIVIPADKFYDLKAKSFTNSSSKNSMNNYDISFYDYENNLIICASSYIASEKSLVDLSLVYIEDGKINTRIDAQKALYDDEKKNWLLKKVVLYQFDTISQKSITRQTADEFIAPKFTIKADMFRRLSNSMNTMPFGDAVEYLKSVKKYSKTEYAKNATSFYSRVFSCFTVLVMMLASMCFNLRSKKNVFLLSMALSLSLGVVYYALQMITQSAAQNGFLKYPIMGMLIPIIVVLFIASCFASRIST